MTFLKFREAVGAPPLRADSVVHDEQSVRVVLVLDLGEARIVVSPVRLLPSLLKVVALAHVRSALRHNRAKLFDASIDSFCGRAAVRNFWFVTWNAGVGRVLAVGHDHEGERGEIGRESL